MPERRALRVAIVGSGPAGMYAAGHLLEGPGGTFVNGTLEKLVNQAVEVDVMDRLPTPWGLIRGGVAPDHPDKKRMSRLYESIALRPGFRFFGNVEVGRDVAPADLAQWYDAVIYAVGAEHERSLGIPGEALPGCWSARKFVGWYNGHPDFADLPFKLDSERAVIIGNGNVAMDVARMLLKPVEELAKTDIAPHALDALAASKINEVVILGRRGPEHAAFNTPELEELGELADTRIEAQPLPMDNAALGGGHETRLKLDTLRELCRSKTRGSRRILFRFHASPLNLSGNGRVEQLSISHSGGQDGQAQESTLETGLVLAAIGYRGRSLAGLPFDETRGVIPNQDARILNGADPLPGAYVTGWIRRGPRGIIGTNKKCARDCVVAVLEDAEANRLSGEGSLDAQAALVAIRRAQAKPVSYAGWQAIDRHERAAGRRTGRPRIKLTAVDDCVAAADAAN